MVRAVNPVSVFSQVGRIYAGSRSDVEWIQDVLMWRWRVEPTTSMLRYLHSAGISSSSRAGSESTLPLASRSATKEIVSGVGSLKEALTVNVRLIPQAKSAPTYSHKHLYRIRSVQKR